MTREKRFLWGLIGFYIFLFSTIAARKYFSYSFQDFDLAVYAQGLWNFRHGSWESSILGIPLLGNHFVPILFLIFPLYALFPTPLILLFLQTVLLGLGAFYLFRIAKRHLPDPLPLVFAFSYLFYPALGYTTLFEFHPVALAVFFLLGALSAFEANAFKRYLIFLVLASLCQEDVALAPIVLGLYAFFQKRERKWSIGPFVGGLGYFVLVVFILMPRLHRGLIDFTLLYAHLGDSLPAIFSFLVAHPLQVVRLLFETAEKRIFLFQLLAPLLFLPLLDPKSLFLSVPFFLEEFLSRRRSQQMIYFHYGALLIPFLYYAAIQGGARLLRLRRVPGIPKALFILVFFSTLAVTVWAGPHFRLGRVFAESRRDILDEKRDLLIRQIPKGSPVMATFEFLPRLSNRRELYSFHPIYTRRYTLSEKAYLLPETIQYLLVDFNDFLTHATFYRATGEGDLHAREFLEKTPFRVVRSFQDLVLFERGEGERLFDVQKTQTPSAFLAKDPEGHIGLVTVSVEKKALDPGESALLVLDWYCLGPSSRRYGLLFVMVDFEQKQLRDIYHSFCYRLYPTERWKKGERITEKFQLVFPTSQNPKNVWRVALYLVEERGEAVPLPFVDLGEFEVKGETL